MKKPASLPGEEINSIHGVTSKKESEYIKGKIKAVAMSPDISKLVPIPIPELGGSAVVFLTQKEFENANRDIDTARKNYLRKHDQYETSVYSFKKHTHENPVSNHQEVDRQAVPV